MSAECFITSHNSPKAQAFFFLLFFFKILFDHQLGTFSVHGERGCGGLIAVSGEIRTHRSRTRSAESARPLRVILDSVGYH